MTDVSLVHLGRAFGDKWAVKDLNLEIASGEMVALLGPSGCGKTTTLRMITGLARPTTGDVLFDGSSVVEVPTERRGAVLIFQQHLLFPTMTVAQNVGFGLKMAGMGKEEINRRVEEMLERVELSGFGTRKAHQLSGGQQQRVALARALAPRPRVLLLDEPLSNLDPALREETRADLRRTVKQTGITTVLVTHEQEEAFELGERIGLLNEGGLEQVGGPAELYRDPASRFVATFVGRCSVLAGVVKERHGGDELTVRLASQPGAPAWRCRSSGELAVGDRVDVCVRPEAVQLETGEGPGLAGEIEAERFTGSNSFYTVRLAAGPTVEVAMPGTGAGLRGACVVRQLAGELPSAFAAAPESGP